MLQCVSCGLCPLPRTRQALPRGSGPPGRPRSALMPGMGLYRPMEAIGTQKEGCATTAASTPRGPRSFTVHSAMSSCHSALCCDPLTQRALKLFTPAAVQYPAMDALQEWMGLHRFLDYFDAFVEKLGVECLDDLELVPEADLPLVGMKPIQVRRFGRLSSAPGWPPRQLTPPSVLQPTSPTPLVPAPSSPLQTQKRGLGCVGSVPPTTLFARTPSAEFGDERGDEIDHRGSRDQDAPCEDVESPPVPSLLPKRRKLNRLSSPQRASMSSSASRGDSRLRKPDKYSNGMKKAASEAASRRGTAYAPRGEKDGCGCMPLL